MKFSDFVIVEAIQPNLVAIDKEGAIRELTGALVEAGQVDEEHAEAVFDTIIEREQLGSTGIGRGIAIPHAKHAGVKRPVGTVGVSREGVEFNSLDGDRVHLIFTLISPPEQSANHLAVLEYVSRQLRNDLFCKVLKESKTASDIRQILEEVDESGGEAFL